MNVGLFVPCYINMFYPDVAISAYRILKSYGLTVHCRSEVCCGQPLANSGFESACGELEILLAEELADMEYVVVPSGSCALHLKLHGPPAIRQRVFELTEFMVNVLKVTKLEVSFPYRVGLHNSCHGQRGLGLSSMSERRGPKFSIPESLLRMVGDLTLVDLDRDDECCGFGGTFCVSEEAVSVKMGKDRLSDHIRNGAEFITSVDSSCLMHLEGVIRRERLKIRVVHIAQILGGYQLSNI